MDGFVVIVIGGVFGIGVVIVYCLYDDGVIVVVFDCDMSNVDEWFVVFMVDVFDCVSVDVVVVVVVECFGCIDIVVNNVGIGV